MNIAVFIIILEMAIGFMASIGYYEGDVFYSPAQPGETGMDYIVKAQNNDTLNSEYNPAELTIGDYLKFGIDWIFAGFLILVTIMSAFLGISWILYTTYHLPMVLCVFVQGIIYLIYTWAFVQWRSGRGGAGFE